MCAAHNALCVVDTVEQEEVFAEAHWYPFWNGENGACPACVSAEYIARTLLAKGDTALHEADSDGVASGRRGCLGCYRLACACTLTHDSIGKGVTVALVDAGLSASGSRATAK